MLYDLQGTSQSFPSVQRRSYFALLFSMSLPLPIIFGENDKDLHAKASYITFCAGGTRKHENIQCIRTLQLSERRDGKRARPELIVAHMILLFRVSVFTYF